MWRASELQESFDISEAQCTSDFDKNFIRTAIVQWYGSEGAFTDFVRGPLRKDVLAIAMLSAIRGSIPQRNLQIRPEIKQVFRVV